MTRKVLVALASLPSACALVIVPTALPPSSTMTVAQEMRYAVVQPLDAQQQLIFPTNLIAEKVDTSAVVSEFVGSVKGGIESGPPGPGMGPRNWPRIMGPMFIIGPRGPMCPGPLNPGIL